MLGPVWRYAIRRGSTVVYGDAIVLPTYYCMVLVVFYDLEFCSSLIVVTFVTVLTVCFLYSPISFLYYFSTREEKRGISFPTCMPFLYLCCSVTFLTFCILVRVTCLLFIWWEADWKCTHCCGLISCYLMLEGFCALGLT
jgi:hypothetical protein